MTSLPAFRDLPFTAGAPACSSWGLWGPDDLLGCWNKIDGDATRRGLAAARLGRAFRLDAAHDPALTGLMGREPFVHSLRAAEVLWDWYGLLTSAPMQLPGGVATPANALAIR